MSRVSFPQRRFIRFRHFSENTHATTTLLGHEASDPPIDLSHGLVRLVSDRHQLAARDVCRALQSLVDKDAQIMAWIARDSHNAALFLEQPLAALKEALVDLPADFQRLTEQLGTPAG